MFFAKQLKKRAIAYYRHSAEDMAPYGMIRVLLDETKQPIRTLKHGEQKVISNQRVTFAPANDKITNVVKTIFSYFVDKNFSPNKIAAYLNNQNICAPNGGIWNSNNDRIRPTYKE